MGTVKLSIFVHLTTLDANDIKMFSWVTQRNFVITNVRCLRT